MSIKPQLNEKILSVLGNNDTRIDVYNKIHDKYPELIVFKTEQQGSLENAKNQLLAEITSRLNKGEDKWCIINRNEKPYLYSLINDINDIDDIDDIDDIEDIIIIKSEEELDIGYIYILDTHLDFNNHRVVKIGKANNIDKRIIQLNSEQGSYQKHDILYQFKVERPYKVEHVIHNVLDKGRINPKKEGFYKDYVESNINLIKQIIKLFLIKE